MLGLRDVETGSRRLPMTVTWYLGVSNFQRAISMVIPRSRSALSLSRTHAYLKEPLPSSAASYCLDVSPVLGGCRCELTGLEGGVGGSVRAQEKIPYPLDLCAPPPL